MQHWVLGNKEYMNRQVILGKFVLLAAMSENNDMELTDITRTGITANEFSPTGV